MEFPDFGCDQELSLDACGIIAGCESWNWKELKS